jgi:hypothetical protein
MRILEGLKNLEIIAEEDGIYYPGWIREDQWVKKEEPPKKMKEDNFEELPKKKVHLDTNTKILKKTEKASKENKINGVKKDPPHLNGTQYKKISESAYKLEIFTAFITVRLQKVLNRSFRKAFNRIVYV